MWEEQLQEVLKTNDSSLFEDWKITYEAETGDPSFRDISIEVIFTHTIPLINRQNIILGSISAAICNNKLLCFGSSARSKKSNIAQSNSSSIEIITNRSYAWNSYTPRVNSLAFSKYKLVAMSLSNYGDY